MENKYQISHEKFLTEISREVFPQKETIKTPPLDIRYTFNLDLSLILLLQSYLKLYLEEADSFVDLNYHSFTIEGKEKTQKEWIEDIIKNCDIFLDLDDSFPEKESSDQSKEILHHIFKVLEVIYFTLWW